MVTAIFPGSFDPFTKGHQAIVEQALQFCDKVVVAIGENIAKNSLLELEARLRLIKDVYASEPRVEVTSYNSLTVELASEMGATIIIRGVRNTIDFEYERTMAQTNLRLNPQIRTVFLATPAELMDVSSSMVRELLAFGQQVGHLLPEEICLEHYMTKSHIKF